MNPFKSLKTVSLGLIGLALLIYLTMSLTSGHGPSDATIKTLAENEMQARIKGCVITSVSIARGASFASQAKQSTVVYGTSIYPMQVKVTYTVPLADGSRSDPKELMRSLFLYKDPSGKWMDDRSLN
jgi:hypothetical protein